MKKFFRALATLAVVGLIGGVLLGCPKAPEPNPVPPPTAPPPVQPQAPAPAQPGGGPAGGAQQPGGG